jgi:hypothetical protein
LIKLELNTLLKNLLSKSGLESLKNLSFLWAYQIELRDYLEILELLLKS